MTSRFHAFLLAACCLGSLSAALPACAKAPAQTPAPAAAPAYSTTTSQIGDLLDNPATKAVLERNVPKLVSNPQIDMARGMTLKQIQAYAGDALSDQILAKLDADLAKVPTTR